MDHSRNCGGYALNIPAWITPWADEDSNEQWTRDERYRFATSLFELGLSREKVEHAILLLDKKFLLEQYPYLRAIDDISRLGKDVRIIAYRIFFDWDEDHGVIDYDYHFKQRRKGNWWEKNGALEAKICRLDPSIPWPALCTDEEMNVVNDDECYTSGIVYFIDTRWSK